MVKFVENKPVVQKNPDVKVDVNAANPLPIGANRFQLVVVDDSGNESEPTFVEVIVKDNARPTAVLDMVDGRNQRVTPQVDFGKPFILSGRRSRDKEPGKIVEYRFTLVDRA